MHSFRLPDQHIVETEPKKSKLSKPPRVTTGTTVSKTVTKQPKGTQKSYDDITGTSSSTTGGGVVTTIPKKDRFSVEKVMVGEAVPCGSSGPLFGSGQDPFAMVETLQYSMVSARPITLPVSDGHLNHEASSSPLSSVGSLASYEEIQARLSFIGDDSVKTKGYSKKGKSSKFSKKEKGPHKAKLPGAKDKYGATLLAKSGKNSVEASSIVNDSAGSKKSITKWTMKTPAHYSKGESSKQYIGHGEAPPRTWPTIPNLDYASGRRSRVTFNNETVFITQYKLLQQ